MDRSYNELCLETCYQNLFVIWKCPFKTINKPMRVRARNPQRYIAATNRIGCFGLVWRNYDRRPSAAYSTLDGDYTPQAQSVASYQSFWIRTLLVYGGTTTRDYAHPNQKSIANARHILMASHRNNLTEFALWPCLAEQRPETTDTSINRG
ncbi:MAG: hypothetical protein M1831_000520 [Alyxoria varia]|nr:MAG: hypothetical protein M1831_000520 [Alyxoria varia]